MARMHWAVGLVTASGLFGAIAACSDGDSKPPAAVTSAGDSGTTTDASTTFDASPHDGGDASTGDGLPSCNGVVANSLYVNGESGEALHPGEQTYPDASFNAILRYETDGRLTAVDMTGAGWLLAFSAKAITNGALTANTTYDDAQLYPFENAGHPGLDVHNAECASISGSFHVSAVEADDAGLKTFSASFVEHCNGEKPALRGCVAFTR